MTSRVALLCLGIVILTVTVVWVFVNLNGSEVADQQLITGIAPEELKELLQNPDDLVLVDVREPDEYVGPLGHIPLSRNIPLGELENHTAELRNTNYSAIVLICRTDRRSATGARFLLDNGLTSVTFLRGGMKSWNALNAKH